MRSSSTKSAAIADGVRRAGRLADDRDLVADRLVLLELRRHVVAVVLDEQLDLATGDPAVGVDAVPVDLLGFDDLGDQRSERARTGRRACRR